MHLISKKKRRNEREKLLTKIYDRCRLIRKFCSSKQSMCHDGLKPITMYGNNAMFSATSSLYFSCPFLVCLIYVIMDFNILYLREEKKAFYSFAFRMNIK